MQEVFEKILYDKVLEKAWQPLGMFDEHSPLVIKVSDVKEIVNQTAAEYNNGWIPIEERVPEAEDLHEIGIESCTQYLIQRRCGLMDVAHYIKVYGEPYFEANTLRITDVIAWKPLPEPYKKGE